MRAMLVLAAIASVAIETALAQRVSNNPLIDLLLRSNVLHVASNTRETAWSDYADAVYADANDRPIVTGHASISWQHNLPALFSIFTHPPATNTHFNNLDNNDLHATESTVQQAHHLFNLLDYAADINAYPSADSTHRSTLNLRKRQITSPADVHVHPYRHYHNDNNDFIYSPGQKDVDHLLRLSKRWTISPSQSPFSGSQDNESSDSDLSISADFSPNSSQQVQWASIVHQQVNANQLPLYLRSSLMHTGHESDSHMYAVSVYLSDTTENQLREHSPIFPDSYMVPVSILTE